MMKMQEASSPVRKATGTDPTERVDDVLPRLGHLFDAPAGDRLTGLDALEPLADLAYLARLQPRTRGVGEGGVVDHALCEQPGKRFGDVQIAAALHGPCVEPRIQQVQKRVLDAEMGPALEELGQLQPRCE